MCSVVQTGPTPVITAENIQLPIGDHCMLRCNVFCAWMSLSLPVKESSFAQQQLHHLGVALFGGQMKGCHASLVAFIQQPRVCDVLQQSVTRIDAPIPSNENRGMRKSTTLWKKEFLKIFQRPRGLLAATAHFIFASECFAQSQLRLLLQGSNQ